MVLSIQEFGKGTVPLLELLDSMIVPVDLPDGTVCQVYTQDDETCAQHQQGDEQGKNMYQIIELGRGYQYAQYGKGQGENSDARAHDGQGGPFLRQEELDLVDKDALGHLILPGFRLGLLLPLDFDVH